MEQFYEEKKIVPVLISADINAGVDCDSINMKGQHRAAFIVMLGEDLSGDAIITLNSGATDGVKTTAETFRYTYGGAVVGVADADVLEDVDTSAALTITGTTFLGRMLIIEIEASEITEAQPWLTLSISAAASAGTATVVGVLEPRYKPGGDSSVLV